MGLSKAFVAQKYVGLSQRHCTPLASQRGQSAILLEKAPGQSFCHLCLAIEAARILGVQAGSRCLRVLDIRDLEISSLSIMGRAV